MSELGRSLHVVEVASTSGNRKALRPCAAVSHLHHIDHVFQWIVYTVVYIARAALLFRTSGVGE